MEEVKKQRDMKNIREQHSLYQQGAITKANYDPLSKTNYEVREKRVALKE